MSRSGASTISLRVRQRPSFISDMKADTLRKQLANVEANTRRAARMNAGNTVHTGSYMQWALAQHKLRREIAAVEAGYEPAPAPRRAL